jgi:lysophospholipase L1-like esterase
MSVQVQYRKQLLFFLLSLLSILIIIETGSRIYEYSIPECFLIGSEATKHIDHEMQIKMCDEQEKILKINEFPFIHVEPDQHLTTINVNSLGFRGAEFETVKDEFSYRIFVLGGSTIWGSGASSDNTTIPALLEEKIKNAGYRNIEVINAGVPMVASFEEAYQIRNYYKNFDPDLFIIYDGWNDSRALVREGEPDISNKNSLPVITQQKYIEEIIKKYLYEFRTLYIIHPIITHHQIALMMNQDFIQKEAELWSDRWETVCKENNLEDIHTIILVQPIAGTGDKKLTFSEKPHADYIQQVKTREYLEAFVSEFPNLSSCTKTADLRNSFDEITETIFFDGGHMSDKGNNIIAEDILEIILPVLPNRYLDDN